MRGSGQPVRAPSAGRLTPGARGGAERPGTAGPHGAGSFCGVRHTAGMTLATAVADEVHHRMTARKLSQTRLAAAAGIAPTLLHRAVKHERDLTIDELGSLAAVLGCKPEHLVRRAREAREARAAAHPTG